LVSYSVTEITIVIASKCVIGRGELQLELGELFGTLEMSSEECAQEELRMCKDLESYFLSGVPIIL
jgi:hypothetical protein